MLQPEWLCLCRGVQAQVQQVQQVQAQVQLSLTQCPLQVQAHWQVQPLVQP
jgi:hypothetical protein